MSRVITFAKLNEEDLLPVTQVLLNLQRLHLIIATSKVFSFAPALCSGDLKLLEMPPHLANSLTEGEILTLRFGLRGTVILCFNLLGIIFFCLHHKVLYSQRQ